MSKRDGGPAFPIPIAIDDDGWAHSSLEFSDDKQALGGMTLRDYFAAKAMQGFAADPEMSDGAREVARLAYAWADAMLAERVREPLP